MSNIIIIGTGNFAYQHAKCIGEIENINLMGFVGSNKIIGEKFSVPVHNTIEEAVKNLDFDKVTIVNRNDKHFVSIMKLIDLKKDILCEKPVVISEEQMGLLDKRMLGYDHKLHVVGQRKYDSWIDYFKSKKAQKMFGNIISTHLFCSFKKDKEYYESWRADTDKSGGGVLIHKAIHHIGILNHLLGTPIETKGILVYHDKIKDYETGASAYIKYKNNKIATINIGTYPNFKNTSEIHLNFEKGKVIIRDAKIIDVFIKGGRIDNLKMKYLLFRKFKVGSLLDQYRDFLRVDSSNINTYEKAKNELKIIFNLYKQNNQDKKTS